MGENSDKKKEKKTWVTYFFMKNINLKFQNISKYMVLKLTYAMHNKATTLNDQKLQKGHNSNKFSFDWLKI